jgi:hypothetical protein
MPPPIDNLRQLILTISWFLWNGVTFRVPLSTLQRTKREGGWDLIIPAAKWLALFISRMREQSMRPGTVTADWAGRWGLREKTKNPLYDKRTPAKLEYLHRFDMESAYLAPRGNMETMKAYKKRLYTTINTIQRAVTGVLTMRVQRKWPQIDWARVGKPERGPGI